MLRPTPLAAVLLLTPVLPLGAQERPCPEFRVNTQTAGHQMRPAVASAPDGGFLVVWESQSDGSGPGVFGQRYDASGTTRGSEFRVNTYTASDQFLPAAAFDANGNFVVVWTSYGQDGSQSGVFGQRFDSSGTVQGPEFRVNTYTTSFQAGPRVACDPAGNFVVVWRSLTQDGDGYGVFGQRYDAAGAVQGAEFQVNTYGTEWQTYPAVSVRADGQFVVVWDSYGQDGSMQGVFGRRFDAGGVPQPAEFPVNTNTTFNQAYARVAHRADGGFVAIWTSEHTVSYEIYGRAFDPAGNPEGPDFRINAFTAGLQDQPHLTRDPNGGFLVVWNSRGQDGSGDGIVGRRLDPSGAPIGAESFANNFTTLDQNQPQVAALPNGGFVTVWQSDLQDGSGFGAFASLDCARLYTVTPCRLADTRDAPGSSGGPALGANSTRAFPIAGRCGIPPGARAVALNATAVNPTDPGDLRFFPAGQTAPLASTLNFGLGRTRANNAVIPLGAGGEVSVRCDMPPGSAGSTHLVLDAYGYFKR